MKLQLLSAGIILVISLYLIKTKSKTKNNVCKTFEDYYTDRDRNENCHYNPDGELTVPEIIKRWGYPVETHYVTTEDGYILTLFRIPYGKKSTLKQPGKPVLLQHGYKATSKCFISTGEKSLGFLLADHGYDVWLGNFRGSIYSRNHTQLSDTEKKFWDFSFHEIGLYDIAAKIDYVNKYRKQKIIYLGFSMGTTTATVYSSTYPDIAENKVKIFIYFAPFIFTNEIGSYTYKGLQIWPYIEPILRTLGKGQLFPRPFDDLNIQLWKFLCYPYPVQMKICQILDMWSFGFDYEQIDPETYPVTLLQLLETTSVKTVTHISQLLKSEEFQQFDYGEEGNLKKYRSEKPPQYDLSKLRVPIYLIRSDNDNLSTKSGIERFNASIPERVKPYDIYVVNYKKFNHIDFVFSKDVVPLLYNHLIQFMNNL
ncbi:hypothetical protein ILUMI_04465 [Ignelater luminosus]|uniref:Lipase n=1 Tax=Ignelater luminosus TaxID=2038154 RepID=A0A8K0GHC5_IGNLU|nr:hypothetical protein ILUMI_04465 [Ignelater luminosus]